MRSCLQNSEELQAKTAVAAMHLLKRFAHVGVTEELENSVVSIAVRI